MTEMLQVGVFDQLAYGGGNISVVANPSSIVDVVCALVNTSGMPVDLAVIKANPEPLNQPPSDVYYPDWAFVSTRLRIDTDYVQMMPGGNILAQMRYRMPTTPGQQISFKVFADAWILVGVPNPIQVYQGEVTVLLTSRLPSSNGDGGDGNGDGNGGGSAGNMQAVVPALVAG